MTAKEEFYITLFLGFTGLHRFLRKQIGWGILFLFTAGLFYVGWIIDAVKAYQRMKQEEFSAKKQYVAYQIKSDSISNDVDVDSMEGIEFERYCANLLIKLGYRDVICTPGSGDQGVDIVAVRDDVKYAIQCKRYSNDLGNAPIQEVTAGRAYYQCHIAAVLTNAHFTASAKKLAEINGVLLWDREKLYEMIDRANSLTIDANN